MSKLSRRDALRLAAATPLAALIGCDPSAGPPRPIVQSGPPPSTVGADAVRSVAPLASPWQTRDPFLFCAHHLDHFPHGNAALGPDASLAGRRIGSDFANRDGWNMYHGDDVPGFPRHPHRGFETVSVVKTGLLDHSDSLGATARYGEGDVQWLTAGRGILHAEMFPLVRDDADNPLEMFQIWLNLPAAQKMVDPHFSMLWSPRVPRRELLDEAGRRTRLTVVAGRYDDVEPLAPPPASYASHVDAAIAIWTLTLDPGARVTLPAAPSGVTRTLYFYRGTGLRVGGRAIADAHLIDLEPGSDVALAGGADVNELVLLQGRPIGEPVARHGPFVMNTDAEIRQAYADYQRTQFGGWRWPSDDPVHLRDSGRFALRPDGSVERPG